MNLNLEQKKKINEELLNRVKKGIGALFVECLPRTAQNTIAWQIFSFNPRLQFRSNKRSNKAQCVDN